MYKTLCVWRPNGYISKRNLVSDVTSMIIDQGQQQQCLGPTKSSSWNTHINGGASAQLGLDLIEAPWLWGLSVVPPFMEVLGVTQGSSQKLRIFWPDQEASASVIGGTRRWGGERVGLWRIQQIFDKRHFFAVNLKVEDIFTFTTFTFLCNCSIKNDHCHSWFVYWRRCVGIESLIQNLSILR